MPCHSTLGMMNLKMARKTGIIEKRIEIYKPDQKEYVYDFTVPANQTFMEDNGVIVHNTLNTFHFAGVASKSNVTRGVPRIEEILSLSENPKNPSSITFQRLQYIRRCTRTERCLASEEKTSGSS